MGDHHHKIIADALRQHLSGGADDPKLNEIFGELARTGADVVMQALTVTGLAMVPVEATDEMGFAFHQACDRAGGVELAAPEDLWRAMREAGEADSVVIARREAEFAATARQGQPAGEGEG